VNGNFARSSLVRSACVLTASDKLSLRGASQLAVALILLLRLNSRGQEIE
jgi:hypothetical protein